MIHHTPVISFDFKNSNLYIGPEYSLIMKSLGDPVDTYDRNTLGASFGYRYYFLNQSKIRVFGQFNFSIYPYNYNESQLGLSQNKKKKNIVENTGTIGVNFTISKKFDLFSGIGIGSTSYFFLMLNEFIPSAYIGFDYSF